MPALASDLRRQLENVCIAARDKAEDAARSALSKRAVDAAEPFTHFSAAEKKLRNRLRARGRQVGDVRHANKKQDINQLAQELAYEYWHRMLFARFLAENQLLMHPDGVAVSLDECEELAKSENAPNGFVLAARYASRMLPQVFRTDDVLLEIEFAPEQRLALEKELAKLPRETFLADDSLGWVYQFWQTKKKDEVNASGAKIDGRTLSAVTQLFTEDYMVQFLLHNTIGARWCARHGIQGPPGGAGVPAGKAPVEMPYLRWRDDGTPAAGSFDGWPKTLKEFTMLDPCCGSGHFLVNAFNLLVPLRMHDEGLSAKDACDAVLRDNLFGLELDPRCTQIAAFALAVAAWKYPSSLPSPSGRGVGGEGGQPLGYRELPPLNIACTGIGPQATEDEWVALAEQSGRPMPVLGRDPILNGMRNMHALFLNAPTLGSLIDPNELSAELIVADYETLKPYLTAALAAEQADEDAHERAVAAAGMARAAEMLAGEYTLVMTNVPYLGRGKQDEVLKKYCVQRHPDAKADLATCFVERCLTFCAAGGSAALVTPQNWLFLGRYKKIRSRLLDQASWNLVARLGPRGFETISGEVVSVALVALTQQVAGSDHLFSGVDVVRGKSATEKAELLCRQEVVQVHQSRGDRNGDTRLTFEDQSVTAWLHDYVCAPRGVVSGDRDLWVRAFWEVPDIHSRWRPMQGPSEKTCEYNGRQFVINWSLGGKGMLRPGLANKSYGKTGIAVGQIQNLPATIYTGELYDNSTIAIVPHDEQHLSAIWAFCSSADYANTVRKFNQKLSVDPSHLIAVPFDLDYWQAVAEEKYPNGLPEPHSDDPTQWLFKGDIARSTDPLQVAVARLLGYRWPEQAAPVADASGSSNAVDAFADKDGIVCLSAVRGGAPGAERLAAVLQAAYGNSWSDGLLHDLLTAAGCKPGTSLDDWLRNAFFEQHCKRFHQRPFLWHLWDGRKDGFSCLVNYHKLDFKTLENLTYAYLADWIKVQTAEAKRGQVGADSRLGAAQDLQAKLKLILAGEPPYDIFVRWKPLAEQAIGWRPDLNDGVRMNIRPFVAAGILRKNPNIKWTKDRGKEPKRDKDAYPWFQNGKTFLGDRVNDVHLTNAEKQAAVAAFNRSRK